MRARARAAARRGACSALAAVLLALCWRTALARACCQRPPPSRPKGPPAASWQFAPVNPPPPPPGTPEPEHTYPVPLGQIGDIYFWAPNRGLLITGGTGSSCAASSGASVPCGLYAYNGRALARALDRVRRRAGAHRVGGAG